MIPFLKSFLILSEKNAIVYITIAQSLPGFMRDFIFIIMSSIRKKRIILHLHGGNYKNFYNSVSNPFKYLIRKTLSLADKIIVLSNIFIQDFDFLKDYIKKTVIIPNGLPQSNFCPPYNQKKLSPDKINILYLSNFIESKGYLDVLKAISILRQLNINVYASFFGEFIISKDSTLYDTPIKAKEDFNKLINEYNLEKFVQINNSIDENKKMEVFKNSHFFILPTYYENEGQPISIIEALAYGCVVISTNYRAIPELLNNGECGILIPPKSPGLIAKNIASLTSNPHLFESYSKKSINYFMQNFTKESYLDKLIDVIYS